MRIYLKLRRYILTLAWCIGIVLAIYAPDSGIRLSIVVIAVVWNFVDMAILEKEYDRKMSKWLNDDDAAAS